MSKNISDKIELIIGDGGGATQRFIHEQLIARFENPILNSLEDASFLSLPTSDLLVTTDSYIVSPPIFPGGNIGKLAVSGTVNDLIASGAQPLYITLGLVLPEGQNLTEIEVILDSIADSAKQSNISIVAGDTKVMDKGSLAGIVINTTGIGIPLNAKHHFELTNAQAGDYIVTTGTIGDHGLAILSYREGLGFEQRVQSDCASLDNLILPLLAKYDSIKCMRDPTRGGLLGVLFDLADATLTDVQIDLNKVPIKHEVMIGCEMLGIDPLTIPNEGKMVIVVSPNHAGALLSDLKKHPLGQQSAIIGKLETSKFQKGHVTTIERGTRKARIRPEGNATPRLC